MKDHRMRHAIAAVIIGLVALGSIGTYWLANQESFHLHDWDSYEKEIYYVHIERNYEDPNRDGPILEDVEGFTVPGIVPGVPSPLFPPFASNTSRLVDGPALTFVTNISYVANISACVSDYNVTQVWNSFMFGGFYHYYLNGSTWQEYLGDGNLVIPTSHLVQVRYRSTTNRSGCLEDDYFLAKFYLDGQQKVVLILRKFTSIAFKPAIYLYPEETMEISVLLDIRGRIFYSDPPYPAGGWHVTASPDGRIDGAYDYLYYDVLLDRIEFQPEGWVIEPCHFTTWCSDTLPGLGLAGNEITEFISYWSTRLPDAPFMRVSLLSDAFLDDNLALTVTPRPDVVIRRIFEFAGIDRAVSMPEPVIVPPARAGFTIVEWGGILAL